ncbi:MAG: Gfo/Idh/MocA family oxidoreductase [Lachnospiraceae bacterium]|nr:Gfo/Idh/MocA family oxidoreductase [Lachnospiraceae bacterium]
MRIGIIGPGTIAERFVRACGSVKEVTVYAVASSSRERAEAFAEKYHIPYVPGSYQELWELADIDAVYIATVNSMHYEQARAALEAGKAVLCEKPMCMSLEQTRELIDTARRKQVLLMEGMWTAALPCIQKARRWIETGRIGTVNYLDSCFSFFQTKEENSRLFAPELGGGGLLDVGIYCLAFSMLMMGQKPISCKSSLKIGNTGVDEMGAALLQFADGAVANCVFGIQGQAEPDAHIYGSRGRIYLQLFFGCRRAELLDPAGNVLEVFEDSQEEGFVHEICAFYDAWRKKKTETEEAAHQLSLDCAELMDQIRLDCTE